ncbi:hypothetical protein ACQ4M4_20880 [Leptolyngbya sp. AN02str]|uniref:hypothetical protein n=1 Tax=Leptolyngbya sp. AN02str TaxID=3423363 RepID=UPI003D31F69E
MNDVCSQSGLASLDIDTVTAQLKAQGAITLTLADLGILLGDICQVRSIAASPALPSHDWDIAHHGVEVSGAEMLLHCPQVYQLGVHPQLMAIAYDYFGRDVILHDVTYRIDHSTPKQLGVRRWHRDREAPTMLKVMIYLHDVDAEGGGFEYIPKPKTPWMGWFRLFPQSDRYTNQTMQRLVPPHHWVRCTGQAGTVIVADVAAVYHHGTNPKHQREIVTFTYLPRGG